MGEKSEKKKDEHGLCERREYIFFLSPRLSFIWGKREARTQNYNTLANNAKEQMFVQKTISQTNHNTEVVFYLQQNKHLNLSFHTENRKITNLIFLKLTVCVNG